jgi:hypothetical protein
MISYPVTEILVRRILKIKPSVVVNLNLGNVDDDDKPVTLIVDASGLTVSKKGDYIEEKWMCERRSLSNYTLL